MVSWFKSIRGGSRPAGPTQTLRRFDTGDPTLSRDCIVVDRDGWRIDAREAQTVRLFEADVPPVEKCLLTYRARMSCAGLAGRAYLEMWCRLPGRGEFFSRGLHQAVKGTTGWGSYETPFRLEQGQRPDLVKLNLVVEGHGTVTVRDVELLMTPLE
jgi:hypothetical protein